MTHPPWVVPYLRAIVFGGEKPYTLSCLNSTLNSHVEHICHALELHVKSHPEVFRKKRKEEDSMKKEVFCNIDPDLMTMFKVAVYALR
jgi:hypothetical protein